MSDVRSRNGRDDGGGTLGRWWLGLLGAIFFILGLLIAAGGAWLIALGGSWYYLIAGLGLLASGFYITMANITGFWIYLATWAFTVIWALWEVGLEGWPLVPRLVAPTILLIAVLLSIPAFRDRQTDMRRWGGAAALILAGVFSAHFLAGGPRPVLAQQQSQPATTDSGDNAPTKEPPPFVENESDGQGSATDATEQTAPTSAQTEQPTSPEAVTPVPAGSESKSQEAATTTAPSEPTTPTGLTVSAKPLNNYKPSQHWPSWGGTVESKRYSPLDQINKDNVAKLKQVWSFESGDMPSEAAKGKYSPEHTPLEMDGSLYYCTAKNIIIALDAVNGEEEWRFDPQVPDDAIPYGATCRGVAYFENPDLPEDALCKHEIIEGTLDARLIAVDAALGQPCEDFGKNGEVDLAEGIGETVPGWYGNVAAPVIVRGIVVMGAQVKDGQAEDAPSGVIRGYDAATGKLAWAWDMCNPDLTGVPPDGQTYTRGTPNMWTSAAGDEELGYVYVPLGNSAVDYYGGNRSECENEYSSSVVALNVTTGKEVWHFQTVHYDVWDYDLGSQPTLVDFPTDNGTVPALIQASKQGQIYVLDRRTGKPLHSVESRKVPTDVGVEPDNLSETQPYSGYASLDKDRLTEKDMWGMSPLDQLWCRIQFRRATYEGEYTPPTVKNHFVEYPGYNGGSDWGSLAVDPVRGLIIANYNDMPNHNRLLTREEADERGLTSITVGHGKHNNPQVGSPYAIDINAGWRLATGMLCKEPPYGWIRAIDLKTGKTKWDHPFGDASANGPFGIPSMMPVTIGTPNNGGSVVTAGGLIFIAATTDNKFRAIDTDTGEVLWETELPAGGQANPMTYEVNGRQYVVIAPGGHHFMETPIGDYVIAFALPQ